MTIPIPATHLAIALTHPGAHNPLTAIHLPTPSPSPGEALIKVTHTSASPLDLHRAAGGLGVPPPSQLQDQQHPFILGIAVGGTVVTLGSDDAAVGSEGGEEAGKHNPPLRVGDKVIGFVQDGDPRTASFQEYVSVPLWRLSRVPEGMSMEEAVTVPDNLATAVNTAVTDLELEMPWPLSGSVSEQPKVGEGEQEKESNKKLRPVLVWGAASSVGMYLVQVLRAWGYGNVWAVASGRNHEMLKGLGARVCFDYRRKGVVEEILRFAAADDAAVDGEEEVKKQERTGPKVPFIVDCIGSRDETLRPISRIAEKGSRVAVMLPVINVHAAEGRTPEYEMDVGKVLPGDWAEGVELRGVRTFHYHKVRRSSSGG